MNLFKIDISAIFHHIKYTAIVSGEVDGGSRTKVTLTSLFSCDFIYHLHGRRAFDGKYKVNSSLIISRLST